MGTPLRLLILEDRPADVELMVHELRRDEFEPLWQQVDSESDYLHQLDPGLDVILADYTLPQFDALQALHHLQARGLDIPFIVVTVTISEEAAVECMKQGAADFLLKDRLSRLGPAVRHALAARELRGERRLAEEALKKAKEELEFKVEERTIELTQLNEQLLMDIAIRERVEEELKGTLREKEVLLKEIHHRVKNNLQVISSLLSLQSEYAKDGQTQAMFKDCQLRVRSMALIHDKLYHSKDLARVDFAEYAQNLTTYLLHSFGVYSDRIALKITIGHVLLDVETAIPCGLILNELMSNCLKHAFPDERAGEIHVMLQVTPEGKFSLMVHDNGVGFPPELDFRTTESLGLQLVNTLASQLGGTLELERNDGTTFTLIFAAR